MNRRVVAVRHDQRLVVAAREELIVGANRIGLMRTIEVALRLVHVRLGNGGADVLERQPERREQRGIDLDTDRRLLPAADVDEPDAAELRDLLREPRVGEVFDLGERHRRRGQRKRQDWRIGGVRLAVHGRVGQIARQVGAARVDRRLHFLLRDVDVQIEVELQRDH